MSQKSKLPFTIGQYVVYPLHGLGKLIDIIEQKVGTQVIQCYKIAFQKKDITIYVPLLASKTSGMRSLIKESAIDYIYQVLKSQSTTLRIVWNRRSKEYGDKLNSGDIIEAAEVLRDLYRNINNPNRSYTESIIYDEAIYRVTSEIAIVLGCEYNTMEDKILDILDKYHETYQDSINDDFDDIVAESSIDSSSEVSPDDVDTDTDADEDIAA